MHADSPAPNPVAALEQIRERNEAAIRHRALTEATVATLPEGDVRLLLKVAEAALKFHQPYTSGEPPYAQTGCGNCLDAYGEREEWPCDEYQAISAVLLDKEDTDGSHH